MTYSCTARQKGAEVEILNANEIAKKAGDAAFGNPLVENSWRSHVVEMIVECVLFPEWKWSAEGWSGWDFEHVKTGLRLEIKQSAAKQSWKGTPKRTSQPRFRSEPPKCTALTGSIRDPFRGEPKFTFSRTIRSKTTRLITGIHYSGCFMLCGPAISRKQNRFPFRNCPVTCRSLNSPARLRLQGFRLQATEASFPSQSFPKRQRCNGEAKRKGLRGDVRWVGAGLRLRSLR